MEKVPMCRICLAENVRMFIVVNRNLHELYEKLTDIPFVTEDSRPILACFFCCAKLKQCYRLLRQCLGAEQLFAQMMNEDYEPNSSINQHHLEYSGFIKSPTEYISIVDIAQTEKITIKEELPNVCGGSDDIIEPKEEHQSDELELENLDNSCVDVADIPPHHTKPSDYESDSEDDVPLMEFKAEVEEVQEVFPKKRRGRETKRTAISKKPKLEETIAAEQTKQDKSDWEVIRTTQKPMSKSATYLKGTDKCNQRSFNRLKKERQHTRTQIIKASYKCDECQRSFSVKGNLSRHIRIHTGEKPYKCDVCPRSFGVKGSLLSHIRIHTGETPYKCDVCQCSFSVKSSLRQHIRIHTGEKPYKCDVCPRSFGVKDSLLGHTRIHTGEKPYKCDVCQRSFSLNSNLTKHIRIHTGEKPYKCDVCQCSFSVKSNLKQHIRIHTGEKRYKCDVCQRSFSLKSNLTKHIPIHTGEKPYKCDVCQCSFSGKSNLNQHIRIHTGGKPYKCDVCQRSFSVKSNLTKHIRMHCRKTFQM